MPTNRRRRRAGRRLDVRSLTFDLCHELLHGRAMFEAVSDEDLRAAWDEHGETILPLWVKHFPGTRPFGWWLCDAPGERQTTPATELYPGWSRERDLLHGVLHTQTIPALQEAEEDFLRRHKLLSRAEAAALDADDAEKPGLPWGEAYQRFSVELLDALGMTRDELHGR